MEIIVGRKFEELAAGQLKNTIVVFCGGSKRSVREYFTRESLLENFCAISAVPSREALSEITISRSGIVSAKRASIVSTRNASPLQTGIPILTFGIFTMN
jgi:hypothetical protein